MIDIDGEMSSFSGMDAYYGMTVEVKFLGSKLDLIAKQKEIDEAQIDLVLDKDQ